MNMNQDEITEEPGRGGGDKGRMTAHSNYSTLSYISVKPAQAHY